MQTEGLSRPLNNRDGTIVTSFFAAIVLVELVFSNLRVFTPLGTPVLQYSFTPSLLQLLHWSF